MNPWEPLLCTAKASSPTLTYQNLEKSRVPINSILGSIIGTCKKVGFGRFKVIKTLKQSLNPRP